MGINAQVTIGGLHEPNNGTLLDLKMNEGATVNSTKGLFPQKVALKNIRTEIDLAITMGVIAGSLDHQQHIGLVVYNTEKK